MPTASLRPRADLELPTAATGRLTSQDIAIAELLLEHQVLTTAQIAAAAFSSPISARHRLLQLYRIRIVDRFRPFQRLGSAPHHWVLDETGAAVLAAKQGKDPADLGYRRDRTLKVGQSNRLTHLFGANTMFTDLSGYSRHHPGEPGCATHSQGASRTSVVTARHVNYAPGHPNDHRPRRRRSDPARRRDLYWLGLQGTAGLALSILAVVEGVFDLLLVFVPAGFALRLDCWLSAALLGVTEKSALALRVDELAESRAETVDTQAAELRRIERDLHDGAQARLVALGMSLSLAETQLASDPEAVRSLLVEARTSSRAALAELRDLVRGIHPPVLADRGLVGAVQALALAAPLEVAVDADGVGPLPAPVEAAAYFAVAEGLTNVVKHGAAQRVEITLMYRDGELRLELRDDGVGGAAVTEGGGLHGIERRLAAFDGRLALDSPVGGPTRLHTVLPCVSSSPKTSPSSETG